MPAPPSGCVARLRREGRATHVGSVAAAASLLLAVVLVLATPALVAAGTDPATTKCDRDATPGSTPRRCVGPVTDESGGGGDALTIVIGAVVGLGVAGVAFVLVRRQLAAGARAR